MRKLIASTFVALDGVMQAPGDDLQVIGNGVVISTYAPAGAVATGSFGPADPERARWNGQSLSSGGLAKVYGFTGLDGSAPDCWRYMVEVQDPDMPADTTGYR